MVMENYSIAASRLVRGGWRWSSSFGYPGAGSYTEFWRRGRCRVMVDIPERDGPATITVRSTNG